MRLEWQTQASDARQAPSGPDRPSLGHSHSGISQPITLVDSHSPCACRKMDKSGASAWSDSSPPSNYPEALEKSLLPSGHSLLCMVVLYPGMCPTDPGQLLVQRDTSSSELHMCFWPCLSPVSLWLPVAACGCPWLPVAFLDFPMAYSRHSKVFLIRLEMLASTSAGGLDQCVQTLPALIRSLALTGADTVKRVHSPGCSGPELIPRFHFPSPPLSLALLYSFMPLWLKGRVHLGVPGTQGLSALPCGSVRLP